MEFKKHDFSFENKTFAYWTHGRKSKSTILVLPGLTGAHKDLHTFIHPLNHSHYIIIHDLPGWGASDQLDTTHTLEEYAHFLHLVLADAHIKSAIIIGHCLGSLLAITFTRTYPKQILKLFLITPPYEEGSKIFFVLKHMGELSKHFPRQMQSFFFMWRNRFIGFAAAVLLLRFKSIRKKAYYSLRTLDRSDEIEDVVIDNTLSIYRFNWNSIKHLHKPIYILHGENDMVISPSRIQQLVDHIPQKVSYELIPHAGHLPPLETPETLAKMILKNI